MVVGRSVTLRRDESQRFIQPQFQQSKLSRALSVTIRARGEYNPRFIQAAQRTSRLSGRKQLEQNVRFYARYLAPEAVVTVVMFAVFAIISSLTIHLICSKDCKDPMGKQFGLQGCVLKGWRKDNVTTTKGAQVFWLFFWAIQYSWMSIFPLMIGRALFPGGFRRKHNILGAAFCTLPAIIVLAVVPAELWSFNNMWLTLVSVVFSALSVLIVAEVIVEDTGNKILALRWIFLMIVSALATTIYIQITPYMITSRSSEALNGMGLALMRLVIHPIIWGAVMMLFRIFMWHRGSVPDLMQVCFMLYPALYSAIYGRFFLLQLDNVGSVFLINLMQSSLQLAARLTDRASDGLWMAFVYGDRGADAMCSQLIVDEMRMVELFTTSIAENGGIVAASALMSFGKVTLSPDQPPNYSSIWINAVGQLITGFCFDFIGLCVERKYHAFEWERVYPKSMRRILKYVLIILIVGSSRLCVELLQLFCPEQTDAYGVVMHSCDRPSIFQAVNVAFAARNRGTTLGGFVDLNGTTTTF